MINDTNKRRDELAEEMGNHHANPIVRSMYPSHSRGQMSEKFAQLFSLGWDACEKEKPLFGTCLNCDAKFELSNAAAMDIIRERDSLAKECGVLRKGMNKFMKLGERGAIEYSDKDLENDEHAADFLFEADAIRKERERE